MKDYARWYSHRLHQDAGLARWGHFGTPVLLFPTAGGDAEEIERFQLVAALWPLIEAGKIKLYSCDSVAGRAWAEGSHDSAYCSWLQNAYDAYVYHEVVPAIFQDCGSRVEIITAGASIGAFNAVAALCRHPDVFRTAIGMSGSYDLGSFMHGPANLDFYFSSPLHFMPNLGESPQLDALRRRFVVLAFGQGRWEDPDQSWRMAGVLGARGIPNRVDPWGHEHDHDWPAWREMLPLYLADLA